MWTGGGPPGPPGGPLGGPPSGPPANHWGGPGPGMWAGGPAQKKDDWGGPKPWEQSGRGPNGDGWGEWRHLRWSEGWSDGTAATRTVASSDSSLSIRCFVETQQ